MMRREAAGSGAYCSCTARHRRASPIRPTGPWDCLFGDAGSATAIEAPPEEKSASGGSASTPMATGYDDLIIEAGGFRDRFNPDRRKHFLRMNGAGIMNFTLRSACLR